jgi:hypothetical protein
MNELRTALKKTDSRQSVLFFLNLFALFCIALSFPQKPLYYSNQNTYLLHGLAHSHSNPLQVDWLAQTADPTPVFSFLIQTTLDFFNQNFVYLFHIILVAIFLYSCIGIASPRQEGPLFSLKHLLLLLWTLAAYSSAAVHGIRKVPFPVKLTDFLGPKSFTATGLASQYALGDVFQPSMFAVFILLSVYLFTRDKLIPSFLCLTIAPIFHPTYLLPSGFFLVAYVFVMVKDGETPKKYLSLAAIFLVLLLPLVTYVLVNFQATSPELMAASRSILYDQRIPHHANPRIWFNEISLFQIALVVLALILVRPQKLGTILLLPFIFGVSLTLVQVLTGSQSLALLFPWRVSVVLVPLSAFIVISAFLDFLLRKWNADQEKTRKVVGALTLVLFSLNTFYGLYKFGRLLHPAEPKLDSLTRFARSTHRPEDLYLIPTDTGMENFRIAALTPILVDAKSHPYRDFEVVEWNDRLKIVKKFYNLDAKDGCSVLRQISKKYPVTHVVVGEQFQISDCQMLEEIYREPKYKVCKIAR